MRGERPLRSHPPANGGPLRRRPPAVPAGCADLKRNPALSTVDVKPRYLPLRTLFGKITSPTEPYHMALVGWIANTPDPGDFLEEIPAATQASIWRTTTALRSIAASPRPMASPARGGCSHTPSSTHPRPQHGAVHRLRELHQPRPLVMVYRRLYLPAGLRHRSWRALHPQDAVVAARCPATPGSRS